MERHLGGLASCSPWGHEESDTTITVCTHPTSNTIRLSVGTQVVSMSRIWWIALLWTWKCRCFFERVISFPSDEFSHQLVTVVTSYSQLQRVSPTLCNLMDCSTPGFPAHHQIPELTQTHVHWVSDAIQPSHPLSSPSPPAFNLSQDHGLLQWLSSSHQVSKVLQL